jgi:hypothetical protein
MNGSFVYSFFYTHHYTTIEPFIPYYTINYSIIYGLSETSSRLAGDKSRLTFPFMHGYAILKPLFDFCNYLYQKL